MVIRNYADVKVNIKTEDILKENNIIYCITFPNGKKYIGQTIQKLCQRLSKHCNNAMKIKSSTFNTKIGRAIRKYLTFSVDILYEGDNLDEKEIEFIKEFDTVENGYNTTLGGCGFKGKKLSKEEIVNLSEINCKRLTGKFGKDAIRSKIVLQYSKDGILIKEWNCIMDIERELNIKHTSICNALKGWSKSSGNFVWKYKE